MGAFHYNLLGHDPLTEAERTLRQWVQVDSPLDLISSCWIAQPNGPVHHRHSLNHLTDNLEEISF